MRVLGVLDLLNKRAVHAAGGDRRRYEPVQAVAGVTIERGDALALARVYRDQYGFTEAYVADLDAIAEGVSQDGIVRDLAAVSTVWLDAGASSMERARHAFALGADRVIVGLETLRSWAALREICAAVGGNRVAFSLDLCHGEPLAPRIDSHREAAEAVATSAIEAGVTAIIVIDVKKVGTRVGPDLELIGRVRDAAPDATLLAGGGVRGFDDIRRLSDAGCDGVLVATAIHDGTLSAADVAAVRALGRASQSNATR